MRPRFSIQTLLSLTAICAVGVPAALIPGGYVFFLPVLGIFVLSFLWLCAYRRWKADSIPLNKHMLELLTIALLVSAAAFIALFDVVHTRFEVVRYATEQREAALNIRDPTKFRDIALELQAKLVALPVDQRIVSGASPDLPEAIRVIRPISVIANNDYITIKMTPNGGSLIAYSEDSSIPRVNCPSIVSDLFYFPQ